ncbi:MAG: electron transport complex subunit RsxC [Candidatus Omnitrophota bacterium]
MQYKKEYTQDILIEDLALPEVVSIPISQHMGKSCQPTVKPRDRVLRGQLIGTCEKGICAPIHASISGEVVSIKNMPHSILGMCLSIQIKNDEKDEALDNKFEAKPVQEIDKLNKDELLKIIFDSGIVGMGGAAFPTHIKLNPPKKVDTFILNGAECEPYLTSDYRLMVEKTKEIILGLNLIVKILGVKSVYIAIEDNKPKAIAAFKNAIQNSQYAIRVLKTVYPQGGEKQLTQSVLGKEVPSGGLPFDIGVVVQNVATAFAIYEAAYLNKPLYERVVTVSGAILEHPKNLRVRIGTPISNLIEACGPINGQIAKVVIGGPMMGIAVSSLEVPVIKNTGGVVVFSKDQVRPKEDRVCCRCGRCIDVCPARIMPAMIGMAAEKEKWDIAKDYDVFDCIECGLCSFVCPAKRDLVHLIKYAKARAKI